MTRPDDIPEWAWEQAGKLADTVLRNLPDDYGDVSYELNEIARGLLSAERRGIEAERERCAKACEDQAQKFLSPEYAFPQPLGSLAERFACEQCAAAIRQLGASE